MQTEIFKAETSQNEGESLAASPASTSIANLPPAARAAVALGSTATEQHLRDLVAKSAAITTVIDVNGRAEAHSSYMALRTARTSVTNTGKAAREDAQAFSTAVIQEEKRLIDITKTEEDRVKALRDKFDADEAAKAEALRIKQAARKAELQGKVDAIRNIPLGMADASAADISIEIGSLREFVPDVETFFEFADDAQVAANAAVVALMAMLDRAVARELEEAEQARQRSEAERIAKETADREAAALAERQAAAARSEQELAEQKRVIAEQQRVLDEQAAALAKQRADADAVLAAERAKFEAERKAFVEQQAAIAAADAERQRVADETKAQMDLKAASANAERQAGARTGISESIAALEFGTDAVPARPYIHDGVQVLHSTMVDLPVADEVAPAAVNIEAVEIEVRDTAPVGPPTLRLGQIGARLEFVVTEKFLSSIGFAAVDKAQNSCLYHESDFPHICRALIRHIESKMVVEVAV